MRTDSGGKMAAQDVEARIARLERRMSALEARLLGLEDSMARRLAEVVSAMRRRQNLRDAKMAELLKRIGRELGDLRQRLGRKARRPPTAPPSRLVH